MNLNLESWNKEKNLSPVQLLSLPSASDNSRTLKGLNQIQKIISQRKTLYLLGPFDSFLGISVGKACMTIPVIETAEMKLAINTLR